MGELSGDFFGVGVVSFYLVYFYCPIHVNPMSQRKLTEGDAAFTYACRFVYRVLCASVCGCVSVCSKLESAAYFLALLDMLF